MKKILLEKTKECNELLLKLLDRPFAVNYAADSVLNIEPYSSDIISEKIKNNDRFYVKIRLNGELLWLIVIGLFDANNENFKDNNGKIFVGLVDSVPVNSDVKFNSMVKFQSSDIIDIQDAESISNNIVIKNEYVGNDNCYTAELNHIRLCFSKSLKHLFLKLSLSFNDVL